MKRSEINAAILRAKDLLAKHHWHLPVWAQWSADEYKKNQQTTAYLFKHQMGWDITDYGKGDFYTRGLVLFCIRNGVQGDKSSLPYAEKLLIVDENQEVPFHYHKHKLEDIIVRGGGNLMVEFRNRDTDNTADIQVLVDGVEITIAENQPLRITPGQSVTIPRMVYHRFYGEVGTGLVLGGEVSQVNDDNSDNYFYEPLNRFSDIEEDEEPIHLLWNELDTLISA